MNKLEEAKQILSNLGVSELDINKVTKLTFLALCGIKKNDPWSTTKRKSLTLTKDIMKFVNSEYDETYAQNSRESFRNDAIKPFLQYHIIDLNPDNPDLAPQSSKTHYAIKPELERIIKQYKTQNWLDISKGYLESIKFPSIDILTIKNYKSVEHLELDLGRFNVLIGANGSGKSNIIEAVAMLAASKANDLDLEGIMNKGVRLAKPNLTFSSFLGKQTKHEVYIGITINKNDENFNLESRLRSSNDNDIYAKWIDSEVKSHAIQEALDGLISDQKIKKEIQDLIAKLNEDKPTIKQNKILDNRDVEKISEFLIYNLTTQALRGLSSESKKQPLGIFGEGLDVLLNNFSKSEFGMLEKYNTLFDWLDEIKIDKKDELKNDGYKLGKSNSKLYFTDRFMLKKNNMFSAENANEGILHVLFYLSLFISQKTPAFFAIDNIETALNPKLCRYLIKDLAELAKICNKQVIITTHNPAILDGLNLNDDEQRLFEVYRDEKGVTKTRRIKFKSDLSDKKYKISTMWMNGLLGATPKGF